MVNAGIYFAGVAVESTPCDECFVSPSTDLQLQSLSSSTATSPIPPNEERDSAVTENELVSSLAGLSLVKETGSQEDPQLACGDREPDSGAQSQRDDQKESEHSSNSSERKRTKLTAISKESDDELLEWRISDVFSGLNNRKQ